MIVYGVLKAITDGAVRLFSGTGRLRETFSLRDFIQHYGFASSPKAGAELVVIVEGNVITAIGSDDRRYRLALVEGEAALYDDLGQKVHLTRKGIVVTSPLQVTVNAPLISLDGYVKTSNHLAVATGKSGVFTDKTGKIITVKNGIIIGGF